MIKSNDMSKFIFKATQIYYKLFLATGSTKYVIVFCRIIKRFCRMKKYIRHYNHVFRLNEKSLEKSRLK